MNWKKIKKVLVPLIIIKLLIFVAFIFKSDLVSISRELSYYQPATENNNAIPEKERLIKIVRHDDERGIVIQVRKKKNSVQLEDSQKDPVNPIID